MRVERNPPRRNAYIWLVIVLVGIVVIFLPSLLGLDGFSGGYALSAGGVFIALTALIAAIIYFRMAKILDDSLKKENLLAHWQYSQELWRVYTKKDYQEDKAGKTSLFLIVAAMAVIVGIILWLVIRDNALVIILIVMGILVLAGIAAFVSIITSHRKNQAGLREAYITLNSVYLNKQLHLWQGIGNRLERVFFDDSPDLPLIKLEYSAPNRSTRNYYIVRVPVPHGEEDTARKIVEKIKKAHPLKENS